MSRLRLRLKSLLNAPTLTKTSAAGVNRMSWSGSYPNAIQWDGSANGDKVDMQWRVNGGSWNADTRQVLDSTALLAGAFAWPLFGATSFAAADFVEAQERTVRFVGGVVSITTPWSNIVSDTMATGTIVLPSTITGIKDYYKVSTARLWKDTGGTIAVTADGDLVARWDPEIGTMASFTQATSGNRPIYRVNSGNPYLEFDGAASFMSCGATAIGALAQPFYIMAAAKLTALLGSQAIYDGATNTTNRANVFQNNIGSPNYQWDIGAGTFVGTQGLIPTTNDVVIGGLFNGASSQGRIDQTNGSVISIGVQSPIDGIRLGSAPDGSGWLGGRIYGLVLVAASPSAGDKTNISTYLGSLQGRAI